MLVSETITTAGQRTNKNPDTSADVFARFLNHLNIVREIAWDKYDWSWKKRSVSIRTYDQVNSGTVTAMNGSQTITHSGTGFSAPYVGGYIRVMGSVPETWYRVIAVVSSSVLTIGQPYQGTNTTTGQFELRKFDYLLPTEFVGKPLITDSVARELYVETVLTAPSLIPSSRGNPDRVVIWSDDPIGTTYTTGTVAASVNSRIVTGSGTTWLTNVTAGDQFEYVSGTTTYRYTVRSVESDTSLTLYNFTEVAITAASSYTIRNQFGRIMRLDPTADDEYVIQIHGNRRFYRLFHDNDIDELLAFHSAAIIEGMIGLEQGASPDDRENPQIAKFYALLAMKAGSDSRENAVINPEPIRIPWGAYRA